MNPRPWRSCSAAGGMRSYRRHQEADLYIVNSCTVTSSGDKKTRQIVRRLRREHPLAVIALTGCLPQTDPHAARGTARSPTWCWAPGRPPGGGGRGGGVPHPPAAAGAGCCPHEKSEPFEPLEALGDEGHTRAFLKIQDGCTQFCAYCIIPYARGPLRSKELSALREEVAGLAAAGYREVVLTGINLSLYGRGAGAASP